MRMAPPPPQLPPKQEVALALLQTASSVYIHLDPRPADVAVPSWFKKQPQLVLQIGLNMAVQIPDLDIGQDAISCTLSFNRTPEFCRIPYSAIFGLVGEDGRGMIWPESVPAEVAASAPGRAPVAPVEKEKRSKLRVAKQEQRAPLERAPKEVATEAKGAKGAVLQNAKKPKTEVGGGGAAAKPQSKPAREDDPAKKKRELPPYLRIVK